MNRFMLHAKCAPVVIACWLVTHVAAQESIRFDRQIRPILSAKCFVCHGPDKEKREADLRLDERGASLESVIVPGKPDESELHHRIHASDPDTRMPPADSNLSLSPTEKELLDRWIAQGASFEMHWSLTAPQRPQLPDISPEHQKWARNEIDWFIAHKLQREGLAPSLQATREQLLRRVTLDLTGLPPTIAEVDAFLADDSPRAYERVVDRLLESPHYGERMALVWLDAARYADSGGYQNDILRTQWPWRDWVIRAFNDNMRFDRFTMEQLAGDLLENPTEEQRLATGFNRNHRINNEGGIIPEEWRTEYVADRAETTSTVWLGLTLGCARCHDHKYDPISQVDFYRMFAFFNNLDEKGRDGTLAPSPSMSVYAFGNEQEHLELKRHQTQLQASLNDVQLHTTQDAETWLLGERERVATLWANRELPVAILHVPLSSPVKKRFTDVRSSKRSLRAVGKGIKLDAGDVPGNGVEFAQGQYLLGDNPHQSGTFDSRLPMTWIIRLQANKAIGNVEGPLISVSSDGDEGKGYRILLEDLGDDEDYRVSFRLFSALKPYSGIDVVSVPAIARRKDACLTITYDGSGEAAGVGVFVDGQAVETEIRHDMLAGPTQTDSQLLIGATSTAEAKKETRDGAFQGGRIDDLQLYAAGLSPSQVTTLSQCTPVEAMLLGEMSSGIQQHLLSYYTKTVSPEYQAFATQIAKASADLAKFESQSVVDVSIMSEMDQPRETWLLQRGAYDQPDKSEVLLPTTLSALPPMAADLPPNRLGLARWLLQPDNPLTSRVAVNRYWQMYFGQGLVRTPEDFGSQGERPLHPELLDWLAVEFRESGWNVKRMQKMIVMSATYQQSSKVSSDLWTRDPENLLLARGPRFRLYGQALRDQALAASGLMSKQIGGAPVMPYQPAGLWEEVSAKGYKYIVGKGDELYRRGLYTFWRRTVPPPSMTNFDNAGREVCSVRSTRTNTSLQALNLLNDPQYVEAARRLAERMLSEGGDRPESQIDYGYRLLLSRPAEPFVLNVLLRGHHDYQQIYQADPASAQALIRTGQSKPNAQLDAVDLAAMTAVANVLLNLDETLTKE